MQYIAQGRADADRPHLSPRRAARLLLTRPAARTASLPRVYARHIGHADFLREQIDGATGG